MSTTDDECVSYARDCVRLAGLAKDEQLREQLLNMAREWMAAAMHERKAPESKSASTIGRPPVGGAANIIVGER